MKDFILQLIDLKMCCLILLSKMQVGHIIAQLLSEPPKSSCSVLERFPIHEKRNEEEHRNGQQTQQSPSLDRQRPSSSSPHHQNQSMSRHRRTSRSRRNRKQRTDNQDHDHSSSDRNPHLYTNAAGGDISERRQHQSDHSHLVSRKHLVLIAETAPSTGIEWDREGIRVNPNGYLCDFLQDRKRSRTLNTSLCPELPETRDWYCITNRLDHHEDRNHRKFYLDISRQPVENLRQGRDSRFQTVQERNDTRDRDLSGLQSYSPSLINKMGRAESTSQRGIEQFTHGYLKDQSNPFLLDRERQEKSDKRDSGSDHFCGCFLRKDREELAENEYGHLQYGSSRVPLNPECLTRWDQLPNGHGRDHYQDRETGSHHLGRQKRDNTWDWSPEESIREHSEDRDTYHPNGLCYLDLDLDENPYTDRRGYGRYCSSLNGDCYVSNYQHLPENQVRDHHEEEGDNLSQPADDRYDTRDRPYSAGYLKRVVFLVNAKEPPSGIERDRDAIRVGQHNEDLLGHIQLFVRAYV